MRDSEIIDKTYLGPHQHPNKLQVGDIQKMSFQPTDPRPFYLSTDEKEARRFDVSTNKMQNKKFTKINLLKK